VHLSLHALTPVSGSRLECLLLSSAVCSLTVQEPDTQVYPVYLSSLTITAVNESIIVQIYSTTWLICNNVFEQGTYYL